MNALAKIGQYIEIDEFTEARVDGYEFIDVFGRHVACSPDLDFFYHPDFDLRPAIPEGVKVNERVDMTTCRDLK